MRDWPLSICAAATFFACGSGSLELAPGVPTLEVAQALVGAPFPEGAQQPAVAWHPTGVALVVFQTSDGDIGAVRLDAQGAPLDAAPRWPCRANGRQSVPSVVAVPSGWLVAWEDQRGSDSDLFLASVALDGAVRDTDGVPVVREAGQQWTARLSTDGRAPLLAFGSADAVSGEVMVRAVSLSLEGAPRAAAVSLGAGDAPAIGFDGEDYVVAWEASASTSQVQWRRVDGNGQPVGPTMDLAGQGRPQADPSVQAGAGGAALCVSRFAPDEVWCAPLPRGAGAGTLESVGLGRFPSLAAAGEGWAVAWRGADGQAAAARWLPGAASDVLSLPSPAVGAWPQLASGAQGQVLVAWESGVRPSTQLAWHVLVPALPAQSLALDGGGAPDAGAAPQQSGGLETSTAAQGPRRYVVSCSSSGGGLLGMLAVVAWPSRRRRRMRTVRSHRPVSRLAMAAAALAAVLTLGGCRFDDALPDGARLHCTVDAECPSAYRCRPRVGCVPLNTEDVEPPAVIALTPSARLLRPGQELTLRFTASEPLALLPEVALELPAGAGRLGLAVEPFTEGVDQPEFTARAVLPPQTADGVARIFVGLVDAVGNESSGAALESLRVDGTAPSLLADLSVVVLTAKAGSRLSNPGQLGPLVVADVAFFLDEAVPIVPGPTLTSLPPEVLCTAARADAPVGGEANAFRTRCTIDPASVPAVPNGNWQLLAHVVDAAGNARDAQVLQARPVAYDAEAPPSPSPGDGGLVLERFPFGTASDALPGVRLLAAPGVLHDGLVLLERASDGVELGRAESNSAMSFSLTVAGGDVEAAVVRQLDNAGNLSAPFLVRELEWVGPATGPTFPSRLYARTSHHDRLYEDRQDVPASGPAASTQGAWTYRKLGPTRLPELQYAVGTYDRARDRGLVFGGLASVDGGAQSLSDTLWELRSGDWQPARVVDLEGDGNPQARYAAAAAWVEPERAWYLFGGATTYGSAPLEYGGVYGDLWRFDGTSWRKLYEAGGSAAGPTARALAAMAYDPATRRLVLFGGTSGGSLAGANLTDTWVWSNGAWSEFSPMDAGLRPAAGMGASLYWDRVRQQLGLAYGWGTTGTGESFGQAYLLTAQGWQPGVGPTPDARLGAAVAYDADGRAVLLGGERRSRSVSIPICGSPPCSTRAERTTVDEVWRLGDDGGWEALAPLPLATSFGAGFGRTSSGALVLVGGTQGDAGTTGNGHLNPLLLKTASTWQWSPGAGWTQLLLANPALNVDLCGLTYSSALRRLVGLGNAGFWSFDGTAFQPEPRLSTPSNTCILGDDPVRGRLVTLAGDGTCARLEADAGAWESCPPFDAGVYAQQLAFDREAGRFVAVAIDYGSANNARLTVHEVDGGWLAAAAPNLAACDSGGRAPGLDYRPRERDLLLACYSNSLGPVSQAYSAGAWSAPRSANTLPADLYGPVTDWTARAAIAPSVGGGPAVWTVADGGFDLTPLPHFDEDDDGSPGDAWYSVVGHDALRAATLVMVWPSGSSPGTSWLLSGSAERPSLVLRSDLTLARVPLDGRIEAVEARLRAGGAGRDALGDPIAGVELLSWRDGWQPTSFGNSAAPGAPSPLLATLPAPSGGLEVQLAVVPRGINGAGTAQVSVDQTELRVRYRLTRN